MLLGFDEEQLKYYSLMRFGRLCWKKVPDEIKPILRILDLLLRFNRHLALAVPMNNEQDTINQEVFRQKPF